MRELVLAFKRDIAPQLPFKRFIRDTELLPYLVSKSEFIERDQAEHDPSFKQLVAYSILRYGDGLIRYRRATRGQEERLHKLYSIGWGGHVNSTDNVFSFTDDAVISQAVYRELKEEIDAKFEGQPTLIGLLNDDSNEVGRVHFGIVYEFWLSSPSFSRRNKQGNEQIAFATLTDIMAHEADYEEWSRMIISDYLMQALREQSA